VSDCFSTDAEVIFDLLTRESWIRQEDGSFTLNPTNTTPGQLIQQTKSEKFNEDFDALVADNNQETNSPTQDRNNLPDDEGIVISILNTVGYTYMELENGTKHFWIAAPTTQAKVGDHIRFVESFTMNSFSSKTLNRTFGRMIFSSVASIL